MIEPDYKKYSLEELYDALNYIDKNQFPDRVKIIEKEISLRSEINEISEDLETNDKEINSFGRKKKFSIFENFKITDLDSANKAIKRAWLASLILTIYLFILTLLASNNIKFILNEYFTSFSFIDVFFAAIVTFGIYRKSRFFAILSVIDLIVSYIYVSYRYDINNLGILDIALLYFFYQGVLGTFKFHQLAPKEITPDSFEGKFCPKCESKNHVANFRCGCGYEFN